MIRREIFGGIIFDESTHKIFTLDQPSFRLIELFFIEHLEISTIRSELSNQFGQSWTKQEIANFTREARRKFGTALNNQRGRKDDGIWQNQWHGQYFSAPVSNYWSFTNLCNLHCKHCAWNSHKPLPGELNSDKCLRLIDEMQATGVCELSFSGGEPLTKKRQLLIMADYGNKLKFHLGLATNATLITSECADELLHVGLREIQVSFEGLEAHESIRGRGVLQRTFEGIKILNQKGFELTFSVTINKTNLNELDSIFAMAEQVGVRNIRFVRFVPIGRGKDNLEIFQLSPKEEIGLAEILWEKRWKLFPRTTVTFNKHYVSIGVLTNPHLGQIPPSFRWNWDCPSGRSRICIMPQGKVAPCPLIGSLGLSGGDVSKSSLLDIWENSVFFKHIRSEKRENNQTCVACDLWPKCRGGCKAASYANNGDLMSIDPLCLQMLPEISTKET